MSTLQRLFARTLNLRGRHSGDDLLREETEQSNHRRVHDIFRSRPKAKNRNSNISFVRVQ